MHIARKKVAAVLAAVEFYLEQESAAMQQANAQANAAHALKNMSSEPTQWALSGRADMMNARRFMQMRAFSGAR